MKVDLRYIVFFSCDYDYGYIQDIKSGGYLFVITILLSMVKLLILLILLT